MEKGIKFNVSPTFGTGMTGVRVQLSVADLYTMQHVRQGLKALHYQIVAEHDKPGFMGNQELTAAINFFDRVMKDVEFTGSEAFSDLPKED